MVSTLPKSILLVSLVLVFLTIFNRQVAAQQAYKVTLLNPSSSGLQLGARGINNSGQIIAENSGVYLYSGGGWFVIVPNSFAFGINNLGQVAITENFPAGHAALYSAGGLFQLGELPGGSVSYANGLNDAGTVVGKSDIIVVRSDGSTLDAPHPVIWQLGASPVDIFKGKEFNLLGGRDGEALGINNLNQIVGWAGDSRGNYRGFIFSNGNFTPLPVPANPIAMFPEFINDAGQIAGYFYSDPSNVNHPFLISGGTITVLDSLGGNSAWPTGLNNSGQVVGASLLADNLTEHAFIYTGGVVHDLNDMILPGCFCVLTEAGGINDSGQIVASGHTTGSSNFVEDAVFLLTPTNAPPADLSITKTASAAQVKAGDNFNYNITVTNHGPEAASFVTVTDNLPAQVTYVTCSTTGGVICGGSGNNLTFIFPPSLANGATATITIIAKVNAQVASGTIIHNTASVGPTITDPNLSNNSSSVDVTVQNVCTPPSINTQPTNQTVSVGQSAVLNVVAAGASPLTYQWYEGDSGNTTKPVGGNSALLLTPPLSTSTKYWVRISNSCGSVNSATATVTVQNQCKISDLSQITDQEALQFESSAPNAPDFSLNDPSYVESTLSTNITNLQRSISTTLGFNSQRTSGYRPFAYQSHLYELYTKLKAIQDAVSTDPQQASACAQLKSRIDDEIDNKHQIARSSTTNLPLVNPPAVSAHTIKPAIAVDLSGIKNLPPAQQNVIDQLARQNGLSRPCISSGDTPHFTLKGTPCHLTLSITVQSPVNILVTDPLGRRIGFDPVTSSVVNEIGASAYYSGPSTEPQLLNIGAMVAGPYMITGIGTATGPYTITIQTLDEDVGVNSSQVISGNITMGQTLTLTAAATYTINGRVIDGGGAGIGGVTMSLSGSKTASTQTDNDGNYSFANLPAGNYTITPSKSNYTFSPGNQSISNLGSSQTANFTSTLVTFNIAGQVTINNVGFSGVAITLGGSISQITNTDLNGNYQFTNLPAGGNYIITPTKTNYTFTPQNQTFSNLGGNQIASFSATINPGVPILVSEETSTRAIALGSPVWLRDPFQLDSPIPWGLDRRTRVMLFAMNFNLLPGENSSIVTADAEDASHNIYPLTVEYVGTVPGYDWLNCVIIRLNDNMGDIGDVLVRLTVRGISSNRVRLAIGHTGGGPPDDLGAVPTPGRQP